MLQRTWMSFRSSTLPLSMHLMATSFGIFSSLPASQVGTRWPLRTDPSGRAPSSLGRHRVPRGGCTRTFVLGLLHDREVACAQLIAQVVVLLHLALSFEESDGVAWVHWLVPGGVFGTLRAGQHSPHRCSLARSCSHACARSGFSLFCLSACAPCPVSSSLPRRAAGRITRGAMRHPP